MFSFRIKLKDLVLHSNLQADLLLRERKKIIEILIVRILNIFEIERRNELALIISSDSNLNKI